MKSRTRLSTDLGSLLNLDPTASVTLDKEMVIVLILLSSLEDGELLERRFFVVLESEGGEKEEVGRSASVFCLRLWSEM